MAEKRTKAVIHLARRLILEPLSKGLDLVGAGRSTEVEPLSLSVVIASHNRKCMLLDLIKALTAQKYAKVSRLEIIAVTNGTTDGSFEALAEKYALNTDDILLPTGSAAEGDRLAKGETKNGVRIIAYDVKQGNLSIARNRGMSVATGQVIAFLDDDVRIKKTWMRSLVKSFGDEKVGILGGEISLWFDGIEKPNYLSYYHKRLLGLNNCGDEFKEVDPFSIFGGNFALRNRVAAAVGEFSSDFGRVGDKRLAGEEADYFLRAKQLGFRFFYEPGMAVEHLVNAERVSKDYICRSARGAGLSRVRLIDRRDKMTAETILSLLGKIHVLRLDYEKLEDESDRLHNDAMREDLLGQINSILDDLYGANSQAGVERLQANASLHANVYFDIKKRADTEQAKLAILDAKLVDLSRDIRVTVAIVTHNDELYLPTALHSVLSQSHGNLEVFVVDNASSDGTRAIIDDYAARDPRVFPIFLNENHGPSFARNQAITQASGDYITFLDGDDFMMQDSIALRLAAIRIAPFPDIAGSYCGSIPVTDQAVPNQPAIQHEKLTEITDYLKIEGDCPFPIHAPITRLSVLRKFGGFNEKINQAEDWELWTRILRHGYIYLPSGYTAVAYRQKVRKSLLRTNPVGHTENARSLFFWVDEPMKDSEITPDTPFVFKKPLSYYQKHLKFAERVIRHNAMDALVSGNDLSNLTASLPKDIRSLVLRRADISHFVHAAVKRVHSSYGHFEPFVNFFTPRYVNYVFDSVKRPNADRIIEDVRKESIALSLDARQPIRDIETFGSENEFVLPSLGAKSKSFHFSGVEPITHDVKQKTGTFRETQTNGQHYVMLNLPVWKKEVTLKFQVAFSSDDIRLWRLAVRAAKKNYEVAIDTRTGTVTTNHSELFKTRMERSEDLFLVSGVVFLEAPAVGRKDNFLLVGPGVPGESNTTDYRGTGRSFLIRFDYVSWTEKGA
ncbi:glycosyltransferase [Roseibium aggregatum]|uniref:glycosyltransferase n=1 Tax=Roseibium aggregatum TaxID=187304 RepID=UPI001E3313B0|nr:glycosyltransferase [Roseibium aggregatum]